MADPSHAGDHHGGSLGSYMAVAVALAICTGGSFVFNSMQRDGSITAVTSFLLILGIAIVKAILVGWIFMHLKWDWKLLYYLLIPAFILGVMMMAVLAPDSLIGPYKDAEEAIQISTDPSIRR